MPDDDNVVGFPERPPPKGVLRLKDIDVIGILTRFDRDYYIEDPKDIARLMEFIAVSGIVVKEGENGT